MSEAGEGRRVPPVTSEVASLAAARAGYWESPRAGRGWRNAVGLDGTGQHLGNADEVMGDQG